MKTISLSTRRDLKITLIYLVVSSLWIFLSDRLLGLLTDDSTLLIQLQTYKGWFFVIVTSALLYYLIRNSTSTLIKGKNKLEETLREKQVLLSELHHRVKNNLAVICGLIDLQLSESNDTNNNDVLLETKYRIHTLADIEEILYREQTMSSLPFHEFINQLLSSLKTESKQIKLHSKIDNLQLNIDQAIPLGLLASEILSQFRINGTHKEIDAIHVYLNNNSDDQASLVFRFKNIPELALSRLTDDNHIESTLINLYSEQLQATPHWTHENDLVKFQITFQISVMPESDSFTHGFSNSESKHIEL